MLEMGTLGLTRRGMETSYGSVSEAQRKRGAVPTNNSIGSQKSSASIEEKT